MQTAVLIVVFAASIAISLVFTPRRVSADGIFAGRAESGSAPGLWVLVLSQVTTWIFARSLMNAAILGYYYGMPGTLAYAAYYGSFLTGGFIVGRLLERGATSVQEWLGGQFGRAGKVTYNVVITLRLLSEVFSPIR